MVLPGSSAGSVIGFDWSYAPAPLSGFHPPLAPLTSRLTSSSTSGPCSTEYGSFDPGRNANPCGLRCPRVYQIEPDALPGHGAPFWSIRRILPPSTVVDCGAVAVAPSPVLTNSAPVPGWKRTRQPSWNEAWGRPVTMVVQLPSETKGPASRFTSKRATRLSVLVE